MIHVLRRGALAAALFATTPVAAQQQPGGGPNARGEYLARDSRRFPVLETEKDDVAALRDLPGLRRRESRVGERGQRGVSVGDRRAAATPAGGHELAHLGMLMEETQQLAAGISGGLRPPSRKTRPARKYRHLPRKQAAL